MAFFFQKSQPAKQISEYLPALIAYLTAHEGQTIPLASLNQLARQKNCWNFAYYGTLGFQSEKLTPTFTAEVNQKVTSKLKNISEKQWEAEFSARKPQKSLLNELISSKERYFNLYIKPTGLFLAQTEATTCLPETEVYKKDKQTGAFVLQTLKDFLYAAYRLDLARQPQLEESNRPLNQLEPPSLLWQVASFVHRFPLGSINSLDIQYSFTWLLQYASTITATSTLYASYSSEVLPPEILTQTASIMETLVSQLTTVDVTDLSGAGDSLAISQQLLEQIPLLYQEANDKMAQLDQRLSQEQKDTFLDDSK